MTKWILLVLAAACAVGVVSPISARPVAPFALTPLQLHSALALAAAKPDRGAISNRGSTTGTKPGFRGPSAGKQNKKKYKGGTPPTDSQPYCPYGKKADGTCWVRCRYTICL